MALRRSAIGIYPQVTGIVVDQGRSEVAVSLAVNASALFVSVLGGIVVRAEGEAEARLRRSP